MRERERIQWRREALEPPEQQEEETRDRQRERRRSPGRARLREGVCVYREKVCEKRVCEKESFTQQPE